MSGDGRPLVSIVVPVRDGERHLRESLDSIVAQTYPNLEIVVMDDASTDATAEIAASYGHPVAYHRQPRARGQFDNVNDGVLRARGDLVAVYHADDVYEPEIIEREVEYLISHPDVAAVFCSDVFIDAQSRPFGRLSLPQQIRGGEPLDYPAVLEALLVHKNSFLRGPSSMVRASVYREVGRYREEAFGIASDLEMWLRIARTHRVAVIEEYLFRYRRGHGSSSDRYDSLRPAPERYFDVIDHELESGGRALVPARAVAAYEAHRAHDQIRVAAVNYALGRQQEARAALHAVRGRSLFAAPLPRRGRLLAILPALRVLVRLPRIGMAAAALRRGLASPVSGGVAAAPRGG